ncbi:hypothetical protein [Marinoscillum pacificum]|uniref:hypothetical protein n=1 Tax=Marinoscillum pacificum TaxID=392723 RepID=UPI0021576F95|nr:hypothetical protein [Marinoscillum pacificum]
MKGQVKLCYRKLVTSESKSAWEKGVFEDSFREFLIQSQQFDTDGSLRTFAQFEQSSIDMVKFNYLVSTSIVGYLRGLNGMMPDHYNVLDQACVPFKNYQFEIVKSDLDDKSAHVITINFYSDWLTWIDNINGQLLFTDGDKQLSILRGEEIFTHMVSLGENFQICQFKSK